ERLETTAAGEDADHALWDTYDGRHFRMDLRTAPLVRVFIARDIADDRWRMLVLAHHLILDHATLELLVQETEQILRGEEDSLPTPVPLRNYVAQTRLGLPLASYDAFFTELLGDAVEPTLPFGLSDVHGGLERPNQE